MRVLLFILMLTLLPLRGWMGDAMATSMAVAELQAVAGSKIAIHSVAGKATDLRAVTGFDAEIPSHSAVAAGSDCTGHTAAADADDADHCTPCSACGACHSASMSSTAPALAAAVHGATPMAWLDDAFLSADAAAHQKPPIS